MESMRSSFPNQRGGFHCFYSGCFQTPRDCSVLFVYAHFSSPNSLDLLKAESHNCVNEWQNGKRCKEKAKPTSPCYPCSIVAYAPANLAVAIPACSHHKQTTPPILYFPLSLAPSPSRCHNAPLIYRRSPGSKGKSRGIQLHYIKTKKAASTKNNQDGKHRHQTKEQRREGRDRKKEHFAWCNTGPRETSCWREDQLQSPFMVRIQEC